MSAKVAVTTDDLLDALRAALGTPVDGEAATVQEMAEATGQTLGMIRKGLHQLHAAGRLTVVTVRRRSLDGRMQQVPGYRLT